jgi:GT2 family glycosyltransferase
MISPSLCVSIVTYRPDLPRLRATLECLGAAVKKLENRERPCSVQIVLIDNGDDFSAGFPAEISCHALSLEKIGGHGNLGYGAGHNLAILASKADYHLILNPDVEMEVDALVKGLDFLEENSGVVCVAPAVFDASGLHQGLCRRKPAVFDLIVRGFMPRPLRVLFKKRLDRYELKDCLDPEAVLFDPPVISGCFMLFRTSALRALGGFDPGYFLYFEDYDLCFRAARRGRLAYLPTMRIRHFGGDAARKGLRHIGFFFRSALRFYRHHGWRWF